MKLLALDPGHTTGVCLMHEMPCFIGHDLRIDPSTVQMSTLTGHTAIWAFLNMHNPAILVSEAFRLYAHKAENKINSGFLEVEMIGVIRLWAQLNNRLLHEQMASEAKSAVLDERLQQLGLWSKSPHSRDATRHAVLYLRKKREVLQCE